MIISTIAAFDKNRAIGVNGELPFSIKSDFENYKSITSGHALVMGRKTFESNSQPIPGRTNIIISSNRDYKVPNGSYLRHSVEDGIKLALELNHTECFINGGGQIYELGLPYVTRAYITTVNCTVSGADSFFPSVDFSTWENEKNFTHPKDDQNEYSWDFNIYTRVAQKGIKS